MLYIRIKKFGVLLLTAARSKTPDFLYANIQHLGRHVGAEGAVGGGIAAMSWEMGAGSWELETVVRAGQLD